MPHHEKIDYVEFPSRDLKESKAFFSRAFGWKFNDYGTEYCDFADEGINGGFYKSENISTSELGGALIIFYSKDLQATQNKIKEAGGKIVKATYAFPGGQRFHFKEPGGNEFAVWSEGKSE